MLVSFKSGKATVKASIRELVVVNSASDVLQSLAVVPSSVQANAQEALKQLVPISEFLLQHQSTKQKEEV